MDTHDSKLIAYYNKFPEEKRLDSRHGQVEFRVTWKHLMEVLEKIEKSGSENANRTSEDTTIGSDDHVSDLSEEIKTNRIRILDIGAGTGRYSVPLSEAGYDVTAVDFVQYNLGMLKKKGSRVNALKGDARNLSACGLDQAYDKYFDMTLFLGPMYHLIRESDKVQALREAARVTKPGGYIFVGYVMNEYSIITYGFKQHHILQMLEKSSQDKLLEEELTSHSSTGGLTADYRVLPDANDLYDYVRLEDIERYDAEANQQFLLTRQEIFSPDGPADYMRRELNALSEEEFEAFVDYQMHVCARPELLGAGGHLVEVLQRQ